MKADLLRYIRWNTGGNIPGILSGKDETDYELIRAFIKTGLIEQAVSQTENLDENPASPEGICSKCPVNGHKKNSAGSGSSGLMVIMNEPELFSKTERKIFSDEADTIFGNIITKALGLDIEDVYVTFLPKCGDIDTRFRRSSIIQHCLNHIRDEISRINPRIILVMGELMTLKKVRLEFADSVWFSITHPLIMAKNPETKKDAWNTVKSVIETLKET